jgi:hypothetical protein
VSLDSPEREGVRKRADQEKRKESRPRYFEETAPTTIMTRMTTRMMMAIKAVFVLVEVFEEVRPTLREVLP